MKKNVVFYLILVLSLSFTSCNADLLMNNGEISIPDHGNSSAEIDDPSRPLVLTAPTGVNATKSDFADRISITWNSVANADYYSVERCVHDSEERTGLEIWVELQDHKTVTNYIDSSSLESGKYYSYRVTAHTVEGIESPVSGESVGTILASPESISISQGTSETGITISWEQMPYVDSYRIYKSATDTIGNQNQEVAVVSAVSGTTNTYTYEIDPDREAGAELNFAIQSLGETGSSATISNVYVGYTRVPGAPSQPEITNITKGDSNSAVSIAFNSSDPDADFIIRKSAAGIGEETIINTFESESDKNYLETNSDGDYVYVDNIVSTNVEYTYSVIARNSSGLSQASVDTGYLLSPVTNLTLTPVNTDEQFGYQLSFNLPVGNDDEIRTELPYIYVVTTELKSGDKRVVEYENDGINDLDRFYSDFKENPTLADEKKEIRSISVQLRVNGQLSDAVTSNSVPDIPAAITSISATSNDKPAENEQPNRYNVYPVHVKWETESDDSSFTLYRMDEDGNTVSFQASGREYTDESTQPLIRYEYWISARDELGRTYGEPHAKNAYGSITLEAYKVMFESLSLKPWDVQDYVPDAYKTWWRNTNIATMIEYGNSSNIDTQLKAIGEASASDHYHDGSRVYYNAYRGPLEVGAHIVFEYTNFGENANWVMNGQYRMDVNASGNGSASSETNGFDVTGMYPGHFDLGTIVVESKGFSGQYYVKYNYSDGTTTQEGYVEA